MTENKIPEEDVHVSPLSETTSSTEPSTPGIHPEDEHPKTKIQEITEFLRDLVIIFAVVLFIRSYVAAPFQISGSSMEESYHDGEFILVDKFSYADFGIAKVGDPARGDVVILRPHASNGKEYYIKRTIGLPGDTVRFESGSVFVRPAGKTAFVKLEEGYLSPANNGKTFLPMDVKETEFTVPQGQYFVMGDNRNNSSDSRSCFMSCSVPGSGHFISRSNIVGKLFIDFGYANIFREGGALATGEWKWTHPPRLLATPREWTYQELQ